MSAGEEKSGSKLRLVLVILLVMILLAIVLTVIFTSRESTQTVQSANSQISCTADQKNVHPVEDTKLSENLGPEAQTKDAIGINEPATYATGRGIWVSGGKVLDNTQIDQLLAKKLPVIEIYYDYTCNFCNDLEAKHHKEIFDLAKGDKAIVVFRPVVTHGGPLAYPANEAVAWIAANDPSKFLPFQEALTNITAEYLTTAQLSKLQDVQSEYLKDGGKALDVTKLCKAVDSGNKEATTLWFASDPLAALDLALKNAGIDPASVPLPETPVYSQAANQFMQKRADTKQIETSTPQILINGKMASRDALESPDGLTKAISQ